MTGPRAEPVSFAETKTGSEGFLGARGGQVVLDQRIEPRPPRAAPQSTTITVVVDRRWHGKLVELIRYSCVVSLSRIETRPVKRGVEGPRAEA